MRILGTLCLAVLALFVLSCDDDTKLRPDAEELNGPCADLRVDGATMCFPYEPISLTIVNNGDADAPAGFTVGIYAGKAEDPGELIESFTVSQSVPKGGSLYVDSKLGYEDATDLIVRVDIDNQLQECDEKNNEYAFLLRRGCYD